MINYNIAKSIILRKYSDSIVVASFKMKDGYMFSIKPKSWKPEEYVLNGFFKVSNDGKITEYSTVANPEEFKKALNNKIE